MRIHVVPAHARTIQVDGVTYSREIFKHFADSARLGTLFRFVAKEGEDVTAELVQELPLSERAVFESARLRLAA